MQKFATFSASSVEDLARIVNADMQARGAKVLAMAPFQVTDDAGTRYDVLVAFLDVA